MNWKRFKLTDISSPKQWRNLPLSKLTNEGFEVYGANGIIGYYNEFNHELPTLAITCRGATCGNIHLTNPKSYITSNAMALDNIDEKKFNLKFLYYALLNRGFKGVISGTAQPQITRTNLSKVEIPIPEKIEDQIHIAKILSRSEALIAKRKESIHLLDELLKSTFLDMFGDPVRNEKGWEKVRLDNFGEIKTGNTPPRNNPKNYSSNYIEWIKTDNILENNIYVTDAFEHLSEIGLNVARKVEKGALLVACIAGSIESVGRAALTDRTISFNQQINAIQPKKDVSSLFLYWLFKISRKYIQNHATKGMKKILTKGEFQKITMIKPPLGIQIQFARIVEKVESIKTKYQESLQELENLYASLSQKAFSPAGNLLQAGKGELDLNKMEIEQERLDMAAEEGVGYGK